MKNYAKCLLLLTFISFEIFICSISDNVTIGYLHNKILEETVPELKEFNNKLRALFIIKDNQEKMKATSNLLSFVNDTKKKLNYEIESKKMTPAEVKAIKTVLGIMGRRASILTKNLIKKQSIK